MFIFVGPSCPGPQQLQRRGHAASTTGRRARLPRSRGSKGNIKPPIFLSRRAAHQAGKTMHGTKRVSPEPAVRGLIGPPLTPAPNTCDNDNHGDGDAELSGTTGPCREGPSRAHTRKHRQRAPAYTARHDTEATRAFSRNRPSRKKAPARPLPANKTTAIFVKCGWTHPGTFPTPRLPSATEQKHSRILYSAGLYMR